MKRLSILKSKKALILSGLMSVLLFVLPIAVGTYVEAQGLKINSVADVEAKAQESTDSIINIAKYVVSSALAIALIFVVYAMATSNPHAKEYLIGWVVAVVVVIIAWLII
ncbi:MAG: hypothetical protein LBJ72_01620 [Dysgonamonadaceae bacterium]|jgi:hypothetical protein|nr:hypothetical protein [Dysgonamonadaceae bacterium]